MDEVRDVSQLHMCAAAGLKAECEELIAAGRDVDAADQLGWTPLMHAVRNGHSLTATYLLSCGADVCIRNHHGVTVFTLAVLSGDEDLITTLYHSLQPAELQHDESCMALQVASIHGLCHVARWLLTNTSAEINLVCPITGVPPLHSAVIVHHSQLVELFIRFGADTTICSTLGQDIFDLATVCGDRKVLQLLFRDISPTQDIWFDFRKVNPEPKSDYIDARYTSNNIYLDLQEDIVLKNSPCRPVFKTSQDNNETKNELEVRTSMSPSFGSVFASQYVNEKRMNQCRLNIEPKPEYNIHGLVSPRVHSSKSPVKSPNRGNKRKLINISGFSSWLKRLTKRRARSASDEVHDPDNFDVYNFDSLKPNGIDFSNLLFNLGLEDFFPVLREQELDIWTFLTLTKEDLDAMGLCDPDTQTLILKRIHMFKKTQL